MMNARYAVFMFLCRLERNTFSMPMIDMPGPAMESACSSAAEMTKDAAEYIPPPPPQTHLWTVNGFVEIVNDAAVFPDGKSMDVDHVYGPMPDTYSPRDPEHENAPLEWMSFTRWLQCYRRSTEAPYRNMGREQVRACWIETCSNADKVGRCRANPDGGLEVLFIKSMDQRSRVQRLSCLSSMRKNLCPMDCIVHHDFFVRLDFVVAVSAWHYSRFFVYSVVCQITMHVFDVVNL